MESREGFLRQDIGLLTHSDCPAGRLWLQTPLRASISAVLWSSEKLLSVPHSSFTLLSTLMCGSTASPFSRFPLRAGQSGQAVPDYGVYIRHQLEVRLSRMFCFCLLLLFVCLFLFFLNSFFWSKMAEYKLLMKSRAKGGLLSISWHMVCNHVCGNHVCNHGLYISLWCCLCALYIGMQYTQRGCFGQKSPPIALFKCV